MNISVSPNDAGPHGPGVVGPVAGDQPRRADVPLRTETNPLWRPNPKRTRPFALPNRSQRPPETSPGNPLASAPMAKTFSSPRKLSRLTNPKPLRPAPSILWVRPFPTNNAATLSLPETLFPSLQGTAVILHGLRKSK